MMRGFILGVLVAIVVTLAGGYALLQSGFVPANADAQPGGWETWIAGTSLRATLHREAPTEANPIALSDDHLITGIKLYARHCAICHGNSAGDASASAVARGLYPRPPQLASEGVEDDPEGETYWKIKHGIRLTGMPSWAGSLSDQEIWTLALFLKHMDKLPEAAQREWKQVKS